VSVSQHKTLFFPPFFSAFRGKIKQVCARCGSPRNTPVVPMVTRDEDFEFRCIDCGNKEMTLQFQDDGIAYVYHENTLGTA